MFLIFATYPRYIKDHRFDRELFKEERLADVQKVKYIKQLLTESSLVFLVRPKCMKCSLRREKECPKRDNWICVRFLQRNFQKLPRKQRDFFSCYNFNSESLELELEKLSKSCCKCNKDVDPHDLVVRKNKTYCQACYQAKTKQKTAKFKYS